jgi:hypothetical protein
MEARSVRTVTQALNEAGVSYYFVGGFAVNAHGYVRMTRDLDLVIALERGNLLRGIAALSAHGYRMAIPASMEEFADPETRERWRSEKGMLVLKLWSEVHQRTPIDVLTYEPFDFALEGTRGILMEVAPGVAAPIVSLETLIAMKRHAGRPQDLIDIEELMRIK